MTRNPGLYIHIPFCTSFCPYCDFYKVRADEKLAGKYKEAALSVAASFSDMFSDRVFDTVYFGGGTPSCMGGDLLSDLLRGLRGCFSISDNAEITVECNPSSDLETFLPKVAEAGVNRVSLGLQSATDAERRALGRVADAARAASAVKTVRAAGIDNISLDVMLGVPNQTKESLADTLKFCIDLEIPHISAYMLKLEEGTVFYDRRDRLNLPDEDEVCDLYELTCDTLETAGIKQYEISNFAVPGFESRHNLKYWNDEEYLGIGPAAHSFADGKRFFFEPDINKFIDCPEITDDGEGGSLKEKIMLGLRLTKGVGGLDPLLLAEIDKRNDLKPYVEISDGVLRLNRAGFMVSNRVISEILEMI
ncbi:MAG: radical SAM family heme chaperone HemW [Clostridia bacterium]|nr:radical SAM family heme chaperone HemW [Clostridia bacterium]